MEYIYALAHGPKDAPTFFYVGKTARTVEQRFKEHRRDMENGAEKEAYEYWRYCHEEVWVVQLGTTDDGLTESDWVRTLIEEGHPLLNANAGNTKVAKKRTQVPFAAINRQAAERVELLDREALRASAAARRNYAEGVGSVATPAVQVLSKAKVVRQRVLQSGLPDDLATLPWTVGEVLHLPFKSTPKENARVNVLTVRYGDFTVWLGLRGKKEYTWFVKHRDGRQSHPFVRWHKIWDNTLEAVCAKVLEQFRVDDLERYGLTKD